MNSLWLKLEHDRMTRPRNPITITYLTCVILVLLVPAVCLA